ncbi:uncharacterized protein [Arachis hypogaea]|uniref:uncharacterized protein n=1 Tax=Arachis hypogaea TaxID=3818 RepID=UPI003B0F705C
MIKEGSFERPDEITKGHLRLLHIKVKVEGLVINHILVDGGATINLLLESMLPLFQKTIEDFIKTNLAVIGFNGKLTTAPRMIPLRVKVGSVKRPTVFIVVPTKATFNILLGRDWIYSVGVIPLTLHQKLVLRDKDGRIEEIEADDSPCYVD